MYSLDSTIIFKGELFIFNLLWLAMHKFIMAVQGIFEWKISGEGVGHKYKFVSFVITETAETSSLREHLITSLLGCRSNLRLTAQNSAILQCGWTILDRLDWHYPTTAIPTIGIGFCCENLVKYFFCNYAIVRIAICTDNQGVHYIFMWCRRNASDLGA